MWDFWLTLLSPSGCQGPRLVSWNLGLSCRRKNIWKSKWLLVKWPVKCGLFVKWPVKCGFLLNGLWNVVFSWNDLWNVVFLSNDKWNMFVFLVKLPVKCCAIVSISWTPSAECNEILACFRNLILLRWNILKTTNIACYYILEKKHIENEQYCF